MAKCYIRPKNLECVQFGQDIYTGDYVVDEMTQWIKDMVKDRRVMNDGHGLMYILSGGIWWEVKQGDYILYDLDTHDVWIVDEMTFYNVYSVEEPEEK